MSKTNEEGICRADFPTISHLSDADVMAVIDVLVDKGLLTRCGYCTSQEECHQNCSHRTGEGICVRGTCVCSGRLDPVVGETSEGEACCD